MKIDAQLVRHVADLARLSLSEEEIPALTEQMGKILDFMESLNQVDVSGVPETAHILDVRNVFRADTVEPSLDREQVLSNAPERKGDCFAVPKIL